MMYLADRCYIPLLRATDNTSQPVIGALWSPDSSESLLAIQRHARSPIDPVMAVTAYAGPLSPSKASFLPDYLCLLKSITLLCPFKMRTLSEQSVTVSSCRQMISGDPGRRRQESRQTSSTRF